MDFRRVLAWVEARVPLATMRGMLAHKTVPVHRWTPFYFFGGMTLFFFGVQIVTGCLLVLYYRPSADGAFESVEFIMTTVPFGWLIRSVHAWSADLMVFSAAAHLASVFFLRAYRTPRELTWVSGCVLLFLSVGFGFSGYLLPWNKLAFFATQVGTDIGGSVPVIGDWVLRFLRGGDRVSGATLSRFYAWHVSLLPMLTLAIIGFHLLSVQWHGMSAPPGVEATGRARPMPFAPHFVLRELFGWTLALAALGILAAYLPRELGEKADPFAPAYANIRPEWYFMFLFESLKLVPGGEIGGIEYEGIAIVVSGLAAVAMVLVPFADREGKSRAMQTVGALGFAYAVGMTAWGYRSVVPLVIVGGLATVTALMGRSMEQKPGSAK